MRVVSLCPSLTESVFALGRGEALVGRTKFCVQPRGAVEVIERVGGTKNPKLARIVELRPDLVLMNEEENRREDADALSAAGVRVLSSFSRDVAGAAQALRELGAAIDAAEEAEALATRIEVRTREITARTVGRARTRFLYLIWQDPWMTAGPGTYVDSLLVAAGGANVVTASAARYPEVDADTLRAADLVLLSSEPFPFAEKHLAAMAGTTAIPPERFQLVDGELLSWHGARTLDGLAYAETLFAR